MAVYCIYTEAQEGDKMGYVVYDADTTKLLTGKVYFTRSAAKAAITRELKRLVAKGKDISTVEYTYTDVDTYYTSVEAKNDQGIRMPV